MIRYPYLPGAVPVVDPNAPGQFAARFLDEAQARYEGRPRAPFAEVWGQSFVRKLGNKETSTPITLSRLSSVVTSVASGPCHYLAVRNGGVYAWGSNVNGQLGLGDAKDRPRPVAVAGLADGVTDVSGSSTHSLAIRNGGVYAWGSNYAGQLGDGTTNPSTVPIPVSGLPDGVTAIAAGDFFSLAIRNGAVYAWGSNYCGTIGIVPLENSPAPMAALGLTDGVSAIAAGDSHCLAIRHGALYSWGANENGQLGHGGKLMSVMPAKVREFADGVTAIAAGDRHSLVVCHGVVYTSGSEGFVPVAKHLAGFENIVAVAAGRDNNFALAADGAIWAWGRNPFGDLGLGPQAAFISNFGTPQLRLPPHGYRYLAVACRSSHGIAILTAVPGMEATGDIGMYLNLRTEAKELPLAALETIAADSQAPIMKRGVAAYYAFLQFASTSPSPADAYKAVLALEAAAAEFMDPGAYTKLSVIYSDDIPEFGVRRDALKSLKYFSISWELGDLALQATGNNDLLTLILSGNLGLGDEIFGNQATSSAERKAMLDAVRPEVLEARERFKRLYRLSVKDQFPGSTAVERHYPG